MGATKIDDRSRLGQRRAHERAQPAERIGVPRLPPFEEVFERLDVRIDHRLRQRFLGAEIVVDVAEWDTGPVGHLGERGPVQPLLVQEPLGRFDQLRAFADGNRHSQSGN